MIEELIETPERAVSPAAKTPLKAPYPWFGGKRGAASLIWSRLGDVDNFILPFFGSGAELWLRPGWHRRRVETINDLDPYVTNFWRATLADAEQAAAYADWPVMETDLHARHRWLVLSDDAVAFRQRMREDPDYYDCKVAGWWCWGLCQWIGGGWCAHNDGVGRRPALSDDGNGVVAKPPHEWTQTPDLSGDSGASGRGIHSLAAPRNFAEARRPHLATGNGVGTGVNRLGPAIHEKRPRLAAHTAGGKSGKELGDPGTGVHGGKFHNCDKHKKPILSTEWSDGKGIHSTPAGLRDGGRPQLADAYARGRGVHGNDEAGTCDQRRAWLVDWFGRLRDRLRPARVCCGDWLRVCDSPSVTTRLGITGISLDPPYRHQLTDGSKNRDGGLYANDKAQDVNGLVDRVQAYCLERGGDPKMRIAVCGLVGEGYEKLEENGWRAEAWAAHGGYGNRTAEGKANAKRERIWFSPHCLGPADNLFGQG